MSVNRYKARPAISRFLEKFESGTPDECWVWTASRLHGYGQFRYSPQKNGYAHRFAWEYFVGPIPDGMTIDHLCKTPPCVNVLHMEIVTRRENTMRSENVAIVNARKTHCLRGHPLAGDNLYINRAGSRVCRTCMAAHQREFVKMNPEKVRDYHQRHDRKRRAAKK